MNVVVVGGSSGYGRGIALALLAEGHEVVILSRSNPGIAGVRWVNCDVKDAPWVLSSFEQLPVELGLVVYSAGKAIGKNDIVAGKPEDWADVFGVNTLGLLHVLKRSHSRLARTGGMFVHIGSIANNINYEGAADYCAAKAAASSIMRTYRREALGSGVRSVSIEPGLGNTNFQLKRYDGDEARARTHFEGVRQLEPSDLGDLVVWLTKQPAHVNFDEIVVKPLDQVTHGLTVRNRRHP